MHMFTTPQIKSFRHNFQQQRNYLSKAIYEEDDAKNELLLEFHFLLNDLHSFFDEELDSDGTSKDRNLKIFSGQMPTILEGTSDVQISSSNLQNGNRKQKVAKHLAGQAPSPVNEKMKPMTSIDNLHSSTLPYNEDNCSQQRIQEYDDILNKYDIATKTINNLTHQRSKLEQKITQLLEKLTSLTKEKEQLGVQKRYCLDLLVKHANKNQKIQNENKELRKQLIGYESKCKNLSSQIVQKSQLLQQIRQFLKGQDEPCSIIKHKYRNSSYSQIECEIPRQEEENAASEFAYIQKNLQIATQQNNTLRAKQEEMEADMDLLLRDNQQFYRVIEELKEQLSSQKNKNRQQLKVEEGKRLNQIVHKENRHLLQVNYSLSNKISSLQAQNEKLLAELQKMEETVEKSFRKSPNMTQDETMSYVHMTKSKLSSKANNNNNGEKILPNISIPPMNYDEKSRFYQQSWRQEKQKNKQLQNKVGELLEEMAAYQQQLAQKRRQIQKMSNFVNEQRKVVNYNKNNQQDQDHGLIQYKPDEVQMDSQATQSNEVPMSLQQFTQRFQPSLMDTLFIMLRVAELSQAMVDNGRICGVYPTNVFVVLDEPDHPENIQVKIQDMTAQQAQFFEAPEIISKGTVPDESSLIWNIGMIFHYLVYKTNYFQSVQQCIDQEKNIELSKDKFPQAQGIIEGMLQRDPNKRGILKGVLQQIAYEINRMFEEEQQQQREEEEIDSY